MTFFVLHTVCTTAGASCDFVASWSWLLSVVQPCSNGRRVRQWTSFKYLYVYSVASSQSSKRTFFEGTCLASVWSHRAWWHLPNSWPCHRPCPACAGGHVYVFCWGPRVCRAQNHWGKGARAPRSGDIGCRLAWSCFRSTWCLWLRPVQRGLLAMACSIPRHHAGHATRLFLWLAWSSYDPVEIGSYSQDWFLLPSALKSLLWFPVNRELCGLCLQLMVSYILLRLSILGAFYRVSLFFYRVFLVVLLRLAIPHRPIYSWFHLLLLPSSLFVF